MVDSLGCTVKVIGLAQFLSIDFYYAVNFIKGFNQSVKNTLPFCVGNESHLDAIFHMHL